MILLSKIKEIYKNYIANKRIRKLRKAKATDFERWSKDNVFHENWNERTQLLSNFILPNAAIIEFGAGSQVLKTMLTNYKKYVPSDIVKRNEETLVCDLNQPLVLDLSNFDTVVFSGVLEYVYDINSVFQYLQQNQISQVVLSYCTTDLIASNRKLHGWLSDYSERDLLEIFKVNQYSIFATQQWKNQKLFDLRLVK
jgi:hypothetical protein